MTDTLEYLQLFARFPFALRRFLRHTVSLDEARRVIRERMANRDERFLRLVERGVYGYPQSPYLRLLEHAGCELGDLRHLVKDMGLEGALYSLREQGVFVTFEELRGRTPIVRNGLTLTVGAGLRQSSRPARLCDHDRRFERPGDGGQSEPGSAGRRNAVPAADARGAWDVRLSDRAVGHVLPGASMRGIFMYARMGQPVEKWFAPRPWRDSNYG